ncbi:hypothetical protein I4T90_001699 [Salmonella enterica subsp. enterica serovar Panama]|nr:hypothetical protein [Salmonella enterica subsp. enterica serovar Panama]EGS7544072.1 hypothetical protein [Salmonella enterica subsp. enterica serovar Panama]EHC9769108.1 hypothetical protein [Salmonella enterica subsp. enterica serovar Panama]EHF4788358.1 hypothetical protein [Salmonella enterica]HCL4786308.1 hypothetical protein [Salmonella enterica]
MFSGWSALNVLSRKLQQNDLLTATGVSVPEHGCSGTAASVTLTGSHQYGF